jgi:uncharacterized protein YndB with AHSA1/START domain
MADELRPAGADRIVHLEREYDATPDELWRAWTEPERLARWLGTPSGPVLAAERAPVRIAMGDAPDQWVEVEVVVADAPRLLESRWAFEGVAGSRLRVELVPLPTGATRLVLDHGGLGASTVGYGAGWQAFLDARLPEALGGPPGGSWDEEFERALPLWRERAASI